MATVHKILEKKSKTALTVPISVTVFDALKQMVDNNVGALLVVDGEVLKGLFSERHYARKVILMDRSSRETMLHEILDSECVTVTPSTPIKDCMNLMSDHSIRYLPVLEDGRIRGIISIGDVVKYIIEDQEFTLHQLENYISDSR